MTWMHDEGEFYDVCDTERESRKYANAQVGGCVGWWVDGCVYVCVCVCVCGFVGCCVVREGCKNV